MMTLELRATQTGSTRTYGHLDFVSSRKRTDGTTFGTLFIN